MRHLSFAVLTIIGLFTITSVQAQSYTITDCQGLQAMSNDLTGDYTLANDIDCSDTVNWNNGAGFSPVGTNGTPFTGTLEGQNYVISNLYINRPGQSYVGLFGYSSGALSNIELINVSVSNMDPGQGGPVATGALAGTNGGTITNCNSTGVVQGAYWAGGLAGDNVGTVTHSYSGVNITAQGDGVHGVDSIGGLVGINRTQATVLNSYATGNVTPERATYAGSNIGGLVGTNYGAIQSSFATGDVNPGYAGWVGGLVGQNGGTITNAYAMGAVYGEMGGSFGGLVGLENGGLISFSYATGRVANGVQGNTGGLVGQVLGGPVPANSYYDTDTTGQNDTGKGTPETTAQMMQQSTFTGWDFQNTWALVNGVDYPHLGYEKAPLKFNFTSSIGTQKVNQSFTVSIAANDPSYSGRVYLNSLRGEVFPTYVDVTNGQWTGSVTTYAVGLQNQLLVRWDDATIEGDDVAESAPFNVLNNDSQLPLDAVLNGNVIDADDNLVSGASVQLYIGDPRNAGATLQYSTTTDANGNYQFSNIIPGQYYLQITQAGLEPAVVETETATQRTVTENMQLYSDTNAANGLVPVLLIPGNPGSTAASQLDPIPHLPKIRPVWNDGTLKILDPVISPVGWRTLKAKLKSKNTGYKLGRTVFEVPYDWTLPVPVISKEYLEKWVDYVLDKTQQSQVDIVAHSMGGLVARAYIQQSDDNRKKVRRLAIVGTPDGGASRAYYIWEGGDPVRADETPEGIIYFYTRTFNALYETRRSKSNICDTSKHQGERCPYAKTYNFIQNEFRSARDLLPAYDFLMYKGSKKGLQYQPNSLVKALNKDCPDGCQYGGNEKIFNFALSPDEAFSNDLSKVQTRLFMGYNRRTLESIYVGPPNPGANNLYEDGRPPLNKANILNNTGDGTVLTTSVPWKLNLNAPRQAEAEHAKLIKQFASRIANFIATGQDTGEDDDLDDSTQPQAVVITVDGPAQPTLIASDSNAQNIQTELAFDSSAVAVSIPSKNSAMSQYTLQLASPEQGDDYNFTIFYADANGNITVARDFQNGGDSGIMKNLTFSVDTSTPNIFTFGRQFNAPTDVSVSNAGAMVEVTWNDAAGDAAQDVAHYVVYCKLPTNPYYQYLGTADAGSKSLVTAQPWSTAQGSSYVVKAFLKDGTSTVYSDEVTNS